MQSCAKWALAAGSATMVLLLAACGGGGGGSSTSTTTDEAEQLAAGLGRPLPGLNAAEMKMFEDGRTAFAEEETAEDGLGPVFNGISCAQCHVNGAVGGAGNDLRLTHVTRIGGTVNGKYSDLEHLGGAVIQARSLREFNPSYPVAPEVVPPEAQFVSRRITTPLFGAGLIEAIPDATILARTAKADSDGVKGAANMISDPITGKTLLGRFGWKAQHARLDSFAADAYLNEMGITTPTFPKDLLPQGRPIPAGADTHADPEDDGEDVLNFAAFMRFLAPPPRTAKMTAQINAGEKLFETVRCTSCHVPEMRTGVNASAALSNKPVRLYSDLLLHRMGPALADSIRQGQAEGDQFKTAPLWGAGVRKFLLHDGRAANVEQAIQFHLGEASASRERFNKLSKTEKDALLAFVASL